MKWIANKRNSPIYIWKDDCWYNEDDKLIYYPNFTTNMWESMENKIPFRKKVYIFETDQPERSKREDPKGMRCSEHCGNIVKEVQ